MASGDGEYRQKTELVRGGLNRTSHHETAEALFMTSGYVYPSAADAEAAFKGDLERYIYTRYSNPTVKAFEERLALIEGAAVCRATATGMAAAHGLLMALLSAGDRIVASRALFGSCVYVLTEVLPRFGVDVDWVDAADYGQWEAALSKPARAVFLETPSNPGLEIIDLRKIAELSAAAGAKLIVDNAFATPILQRPLDYGAHFVFYSATKHIDGQGRCMGGAILTNDQDFLDDRLGPFLRNTGPTLSPFNAWMFLKGLETLDLRVRQMCDTALEVARFLEGQKTVSRLLYPGLPSHPGHDLAMAQMEGHGGTIVSFEIKGQKEGAFRVLDALKLVDISNNLGDSKSLITHPATTTHQRLDDEERARVGITPGLVRLSVGLEDPADLIEDLEQALTS